MNMARITRPFAVALVLVLTATGLWAAAAEEEPAAAMEKEMVLDPSTGEMVEAPGMEGHSPMPRGSELKLLTVGSAVAGRQRSSPVPCSRSSPSGTGQ